MALVPHLREVQVMIPAPSPTADTPQPLGRIKPIMVVMEGNHRFTTARPCSRVHQVDRVDRVKGKEDLARQCLGRQVGDSLAIRFRVV